MGGDAKEPRHDYYKVTFSFKAGGFILFTCDANNINIHVYYEPGEIDQSILDLAYSTLFSTPSDVAARKVISQVNKLLRSNGLI